MKHSTSIALCALTAPLFAQSPPDRGILPAWQMGLVFTNSMDVIARKVEGLPAKLESFEGLGRRGVPEFTVAAIRDWLDQQPGGSYGILQIDAMSTRNDLLPIGFVPANGTTPGHFRIGMAPQPSTSWAVLHLVLETEDPASGCDIVGYYFDNPGFPQQLRNGVYTEILRNEFVAGEYPAPVSADIAAMDWAMGVIETHNGGSQPTGIAVFNKLYFSLTPTSAGLLDASGRLNDTGFTGATIFEVTYDTGTGAVTNVDVHATPLDLGLDSDDDIDALGMYLVNSPVGQGLIDLTPGTMCYVFSTQANDSPPEELSVVATPQGHVRQRSVLRTSGGAQIVGNAPALIRGRVRALCSEDPDANTGCRSYGVPNTEFFSPDPLGLSISARDLPIGADAVSTPTTPPHQDSFRITGVLSGFGQMSGAALPYLSIELNGAQSYYWLPVWPAGAGTYEFEIDVSFPWFTSPGGLTENAYKITVATGQLAPPHAIDYSHRVQLVRRP